MLLSSLLCFFIRIVKGNKYTFVVVCFMCRQCWFTTSTAVLRAQNIKSVLLESCRILGIKFGFIIYKLSVRKSKVWFSRCCWYAFCLKKTNGKKANVFLEEQILSRVWRNVYVHKCKTYKNVHKVESVLCTDVLYLKTWVLFVQY